MKNQTGCLASKQLPPEHARELVETIMMEGASSDQRAMALVQLLEGARAQVSQLDLEDLIFTAVGHAYSKTTPFEAGLRKFASGRAS